jgi:hypothetical protein
MELRKAVIDEFAAYDDRNHYLKDMPSPAIQDIRPAPAANSQKNTRDLALASNFQNPVVSTTNMAYLAAKKERLSAQASVFGRDLTEIQHNMLTSVVRMQRLAQTALEREFASRKLIEIEDRLANRPLSARQRIFLRHVIENDLEQYSLLNNGIF